MAAAPDLRLGGRIRVHGADGYVEVLLDDRQASPGVKFKDAELLGGPWMVVVGGGWADGVVALRNRFTGERREVPVANGAAHIASARVD